MNEAWLIITKLTGGIGTTEWEFSKWGFEGEACVSRSNAEISVVWLDGAQWLRWNELLPVIEAPPRVWIHLGNLIDADVIDVWNEIHDERKELLDNLKSIAAPDVPPPESWTFLPYSLSENAHDATMRSFLAAMRVDQGGAIHDFCRAGGRFDHAWAGSIDREMTAVRRQLLALYIDLDGLAHFWSREYAVEVRSDGNHEGIIADAALRMQRLGRRRDAEWLNDFSWPTSQKEAKAKLRVLLRIVETEPGR